MFRYSIFCTEGQTRKAVELGAPIKTFSQSFADEYRTSIMYDKYCSIPPIKREDCEDEIYADIPTAEQMINWLESQGISIDLSTHSRGYEWNLWKWFGYNINKIDSNGFTIGPRKDATLAAIDAALEYLSNNNLIK